MVLRINRRQVLRVFNGISIRAGMTILPYMAGMLMSVSLAAPVPVVVVTAETRELTPVVQIAGTVISHNDKANNIYA